jgi:integrase
MGYVTNRDGRWYAVSYEGLDPVTSHDRRRWHRASDEADARALADTLPSARPPSTRGVTVSRYLCTRWLPTRRDRLRPTTAFRYEKMIDRYVLPHIGRVPLRSLTVTHLEDLYARLRRGGRHDGGPLAPKTVLNVHQILRTALGDAERAGLVQRNVARLMDPPCHGAAPEQRCWNEHQLRQFLHVAMTHRLGPAIWLAAMTGMRRGEVLGLRWSDIDLDAATLSIRRSVSCTGYQVHTTPTKTRTSRRAVDLDQRTVAVLRDWRHHQLAELGTDRSRARDRHGGRRVHPPRRPTGSPAHDVADRRPAAARAGVPAIRLARPAPHARHADVEARRPVEGRQRTPRAFDAGVHDGRLPTRAARHATRRRQHLRPSHHIRRSGRGGRMMAVAGR